MLILNQYRHGSSYQDDIGVSYHFPSRYRSRFIDLPTPFVYYEPREGGLQEYFGAGWVREVSRDTEQDGHFYADLSDYLEFDRPVSYFGRPDGSTWEPARGMRWSVRPIDKDTFLGILSSGGLDLQDLTGSPLAEWHPVERFGVGRLGQKIDDLMDGGTSPAKLRKIRRLIEQYERPSSVTNAVKAARGSRCQLCGVEGFLKRDGERYCEVHHLFHLAQEPPPDALGPEYVVVLCASCHRRMHYADVGVPVRTPSGWSVRIDDVECFFVTR